MRHTIGRFFGRFLRYGAASSDVSPWGAAVSPAASAADSSVATASTAIASEAGVDDFKAYANLPKASLAAVIDEAHKRGKKVMFHSDGNLNAVYLVDGPAGGGDGLQGLR